MQQHDGTSIKLLKYPQVHLVHGAPSQHLDMEAVVAQHRIDRSPHLFDLQGFMVQGSIPRL